MRQDPKLESIVAAAMQDWLSEEHLSEAPLDDPRLAHFRRMAASLRYRHFDASAESVTSAKSLMPELERRQIWAKLVGGSMAMAGARSATADSFQLTFEANGTQTRLMYERGPSGWKVVGQAPEGFAVFLKGKPVRLDSNRRFTFPAKTLGDSGISLMDEAHEFLIPSADQAEFHEP